MDEGLEDVRADLNLLKVTRQNHLMCRPRKTAAGRVPFKARVTGKRGARSYQTIAPLVNTWLLNRGPFGTS